MVVQITDYGQLAPVERRIAQTISTVFGHEFESYEVATRATNNDFRVNDLHQASLSLQRYDQFTALMIANLLALAHSFNQHLPHLRS